MFSFCSPCYLTPQPPYFDHVCHRSTPPFGSHRKKKLSNVLRTRIQFDHSLLAIRLTLTICTRTPRVFPLLAFRSPFSPPVRSKSSVVLHFLSTLSRSAFYRAAVYQTIIIDCQQPFSISIMSHLFCLVSFPTGVRRTCISSSSHLRLPHIFFIAHLVSFTRDSSKPSRSSLVTILQQIEADSHIPSGHGPLSADVPVPIYSDQSQSHGALRHRLLEQRPLSGTDGASAVFDGNGNGIGNNDYDHQHTHAHAHLRSANANGRTRAREYREQDEPTPADEEMPIVHVRLSSALLSHCALLLMIHPIRSARYSVVHCYAVKENSSLAEREAGHSAPDTNGR